MNNGKSIHQPPTVKVAIQKIDRVDTQTNKYEDRKKSAAKSSFWGLYELLTNTTL